MFIKRAGHAPGSKTRYSSIAFGGGGGNRLARLGNIPACRLNSIKHRGKASAKCNLARPPSEHQKTQLQHRHLAELRAIFIISSLISMLSSSTLDSRRNFRDYWSLLFRPRSLKTADIHYCVYETRADVKTTKLWQIVSHSVELERRIKFVFPSRTREFARGARAESHLFILNFSANILRVVNN